MKKIITKINRLTLLTFSANKEWWRPQDVVQKLIAFNSSWVKSRLSEPKNVNFSCCSNVKTLNLEHRHRAALGIGSFHLHLVVHDFPRSHKRTHTVSFGRRPEPLPECATRCLRHGATSRGRSQNLEWSTSCCGETGEENRWMTLGWSAVMSAQNGWSEWKL